MTYKTITEIKSVRGTAHANELLDEGWTLIHIEVDADGYASFILGKSE